MGSGTTQSVHDPLSKWNGYFVTVPKAGDIVVDLFGGSGSTLIGCERRNRSARLMEIDPCYADVIVRRWQQYTGKKATLEGDGRTFEEIAEQRLGQNAERPASADAGRAEQEAGEC